MDKQKILIIDDDQNLRKSLSDILQLKGYETLSAESGRGGLELLRQLPLGLVIIDLGLPDISGLEVLEGVKNNRPFTEAIILTGNASLDSAIEATNRGAFSYLQKPYEVDQLMLHIRRALESHHAREAIARHGIELERINGELRETNIHLTAEIAERKRAEENLRSLLSEREVLLREVHHRVKNNLQVISSLLNMQSRYLMDPMAKDIFEASVNRIQSMARIHEKLYRSESLARIDLAGYIRDLASGLVRTCSAGGEVALSIDIDDISLGIDSSIHLGLLVNELVANVLKHAFPEDGTGKVGISLKKAEDHFLLTISDDGMGFPENVDFRNTESLGMQLVVTLVEQLKGDIELVRGKGTTFRITFEERV